MDKHELAKRLMSTFLEELHEHVVALNDNLLALEKKPAAAARDELLQTVFRSAHSLKGASRAVSVSPIETVCHQIEEFLSEVRAGNSDISQDMFTLLFKSVDAIEEAGMRLRDEQGLEDSALHSLATELEEAIANEQSGTAYPATQQQDEISTTKSTEPSTTVPVDIREQVDTVPVEATESPQVARVSGSVRVNAEKLDSLVAHAGELLVARQRIEARPNKAQAIGDRLAELRNRWREVERMLRQVHDKDPAVDVGQLARPVVATLQQTGDSLKELEKDLDQFTARMGHDARMLGQICDTLDDEVHNVRMLPFAEACGGLARAVRDIAQTQGKQVQLEIKGEDVEVDRSVLEGLKDPLLHLVRNAVDHGIESTDERESNGKPTTASIIISAELRGGQMEVVIADDGAGIDLDRIRERLQKFGRPVPQDDRHLLSRLFDPGFSTAAIVTDVSGRGVGLDVVQSRIEALHGSVEVSFEPNAGTRFTMTVPLTLSTIRCVLVKANRQTYAIPTGSVEQLVRFGPDQMTRVAGRQALRLGGTPIPLALLSESLGMPAPRRPSGDGKALAVVLAGAGEEAAFIVDEFVSESEVMVKNLGARVRRVSHVSGATLLPSGRIALVLNPGNVIRSALGTAFDFQASVESDEALSQAARRLLVVEDSLTTRTLMKSILETQGFDVAVAADGQQALDMLASNTFDLVVSDVDMPRMDGFSLTAAMRTAQDLTDLPVILVTARETEADKRRGIQVGANAYLVKSAFDQQNLLETIDQLL